MLAVDPTARTDRKTCPSCGGSAAGCRSLEWLAGRRCCAACPPHGHDHNGHH